jgi:predicted nucleic-acid-binding Zn-ribbon protein
MNSRALYIALLSGIILLMSACGTANMTNFYNEHKSTLDSIKETYAQQYPNAPFSVAFSNKDFNSFSLEITTDTIKYIYDFNVGEERLNDSLIKYKMSPEGIATLVRLMQSIRCIWINNQDYYVNGNYHSAVYMSIRPRAFSFPFAYKKYEILAYFNRPQVFNEKGILMDGRRRKTIRKLNNNTFRKITDRVCYTVSSLYR